MDEAKQVTRIHLEKLLSLDPIEPRGWFRWLFDHYARRCPASAAGYYAIISEDWRDINPVTPDECKDKIELWLSALQKHPWHFGTLGFTGAAETCWDNMSGYARGDFLAGLSEIWIREEKDPAISFDWIASHLAGSDFTPESACQLTCNAIWCARMDVAKTIIQTAPCLTATIKRDFYCNDDDGFYNDFRKTIAQLSHRVIDIILEASILSNSPEAVRFALQHGANPNIPMWQLERSFNKLYSALAFAIYNESREIAPILLDAGASPVGPANTTPNDALYYAVKQKWDDFAEKLILRGGSLVDSEKEERIRHFFFPANHREWMHNVIAPLISLVPIILKPVFWYAHAQGYHDTFLNNIIGNPERIKRYEALGLDTRLTAEELYNAIQYNADDGLKYLLSKYGNDTVDKALDLIKTKYPEFGMKKNT